MRIYSFIVLVSFSILVFAQDNTSNWSVRWAQSEIKQGEIAELIVTCSISDNWYMYASDFDPSLGPVVTELELAKHASYSTVGKLVSYKRKEKFDSLWMGKITYFINKAEYRIKIKVLAETSPVIKGILRYQVCSDIEGRCIPGSYDLVVPKLKVIASPNKTVITNSEVLPSATSSSEKIQKLEAERAKTDVSVPYLKSFISKYRKP
jgi:thiol:disulfide interchange protein DsbD